METVFLIDDDLGVRKSLCRVLREEGFAVEVFESADAFLARADRQQPDCLVLDVTMPGMDGLELQRRLTEEGQPLPIVFLTGHGDIPMSVQAIKAGAVDFLTKPVQPIALLSAVRAAIELGMSAHRARAEIEGFENRFATLTWREREVLTAVVKGKLNKQIAGELGIVEQTVKFHRARIMERMQARTVAELIHIAARLGFEAAATEPRATPAPKTTAPKSVRS